MNSKRVHKHKSKYRCERPECGGTFYDQKPTKPKEETQA